MMEPPRLKNLVTTYIIMHKYLFVNSFSKVFDESDGLRKKGKKFPFFFLCTFARGFHMIGLSEKGSFDEKTGKNMVKMHEKWHCDLFILVSLEELKKI